MFNNPQTKPLWKVLNLYSNWATQLGGGIPYRPNHSIIPPRFNYFSLYPHYIPPHHLYNIAREWDWVIKYQIIHQPGYISYIIIDKSSIFPFTLGYLENFSHQPPKKWLRPAHLTARQVFGTPGLNSPRDAKAALPRARRAPRALKGKWSLGCSLGIYPLGWSEKWEIHL